MRGCDGAAVAALPCAGGGCAGGIRGDATGGICDVTGGICDVDAGGRGVEDPSGPLCAGGAGAGMTGCDDRVARWLTAGGGGTARRAWFVWGRGDMGKICGYSQMPAATITPARISRRIVLLPEPPPRCCGE